MSLTFDTPDEKHEQGTADAGLGCSSRDQKRKGWHVHFMEEAYHWAERSTCAKWKVGCVLVRERRVVSTGYNGTISGSEHCVEYWKRRGVDTSGEEFRIIHRGWSKCHEIHAEQNAILFAAKSGMSTNLATLYTTLSPCIECAKIIVTCGIRQVYYHVRKDQNGLDFLQDHNIKVEQVELPSRQNIAKSK